MGNQLKVDTALARRMRPGESPSLWLGRGAADPGMTPDLGLALGLALGDDLGAYRGLDLGLGPGGFWPAARLCCWRVGLRPLARLRLGDRLLSRDSGWQVQAPLGGAAATPDFWPGRVGPESAGPGRVWPEDVWPEDVWRNGNRPKNGPDRQPALMAPLQAALGPRAAPLWLAAGALGAGLPRRGLCLAPDQALLIAGPAVLALCASHEVLLPAAAFPQAVVLAGKGREGVGAFGGRGQGRQGAAAAGFALRPRRRPPPVWGLACKGGAQILWVEGLWLWVPGHDGGQDRGQDSGQDSGQGKGQAGIRGAARAPATAPGPLCGRPVLDLPEAKLFLAALSPRP